MLLSQGWAASLGMNHWPLSCEHGGDSGFCRWRELSRDHIHARSRLLFPLFRPRQNEELWVHQLHTTPKNASRHLETRQTMDSASREPEDNIKVSCESEKFYFILDSSRPRKSHSPFSLHQNVVSGEKARKGVDTWDTGHFIQMEEWTPSEKDSLNYQPWQLQTWSDI